MDKVLVVDDEIINLMLVKKILENDYEVVQANSCDEAISALATFTPTIILLDIHMPEVDGYETLKRIRQIDGLHNVPIIFLTADDDSLAEVKGFELGADDFVKKPFVSAVVKRRVERSIENYRLHCNLALEVERKTKEAEYKALELKKLSVDVIKALTNAIDAKDRYTKGHSIRVADYSVMLAKRLGWNEDRIDQLRYKALLHDFGKISVPDRILNKDGRLTDEEFTVIKSHTTVGSELLKNVSSLSNMYEVARSHHERYDGNGYPDHLKGKDIPEEARIVGIADAYDAMSSDRVYRKALPKDIIRQELIKGRGTQFDPEMLDLFLELFDSNAFDELYKDEEIPASMDISKIINNILKENITSGAMKLSSSEMSKLYTYIHNIHNRFGFEFSTVTISISLEESISNEELDRAMKALEFSIIQSVRNVDIVNKISSSQYLLILAVSDVEKINIIIDRIIAGFYKNNQNSNIKPVYEIR